MTPPGKMLFPPKEDSPLQESTPCRKLRGRPSDVHRKTSVTFPVFLRSELRSDAVLPCYFLPGNPDATPASGIPFQRPPSGTDRDPEELPVPEGMQELPGRDGLHGRRAEPTATGSRKRARPDFLCPSFFPYPFLYDPFSDFHPALRPRVHSLVQSYRVFPLASK